MEELTYEEKYYESPCRFYEVAITKKEFYTVYVEAENEEDAKRQAMADYEACPKEYYNDFDHEIEVF